MGLPVLNFKFLPDRCHWGRNSSCLQRQEGAAGVGLASPSLSEAATCSFCLERVTLPWCRCPARGVGAQPSTVCKALPSRLHGLTAAWMHIPESTGVGGSET